MTEVRALLLKVFDHHRAPTAQDVLRRRGGEVAELRVKYAQAMAENVRLSAELAAANATIADLERQADLSARQRNARMSWFA